MTKRKVIRKPRMPKRAAKPPPKVDVRNLYMFVRESHVVADAMRGELVELLSALQGNRDSDELILNALAALAGSLEALHGDTGSAVRELEKMRDLVCAHPKDRVRINVASFIGEPPALTESAVQS